MSTSPNNLQATIVTATWDSGPNEGTVIARLTNWSHSFSVGGQAFSAVRMGLRFTEQTGTTDDSPVYIDLPDDIYPFDLLGAGVPLAQIRIDIDRIIPGTDASRYTEWAGLVGNARQNPSNIAGVVRIRVDGVGSFLNVPLGLLASTRCQHAKFGNDGCKFDRSPITYEGTIAAVNAGDVAGRLAVNFDATTPDLSDLRWRNGDISIDGAVVQIRASVGAPGGGDPGEAEFDVTAMNLPASWVGEDCVIRQGCDHTQERCEQLGNETNFVAIGKGMPTRNPIFDKAG